MMELRLPPLESSKALLDKLDPSQAAVFNQLLLDALWKSYDAGQLPIEVIALLRDWLAGAHFASDPVVQQRIQALRDSGLIPPAGGVS